MLNYLIDQEGVGYLNVIEKVKIENRHVRKLQNRQQMCEGSTIDMCKLMVTSSIVATCQVWSIRPTWLILTKRTFLPIYVLEIASQFGNFVVNVPLTYHTYLICVVYYRIVCPLIGFKKADPLVDNYPHQHQKHTRYLFNSSKRVWCRIQIFCNVKDKYDYSGKSNGFTSFLVHTCKGFSNGPDSS